MNKLEKWQIIIRRFHKDFSLVKKKIKKLTYRIHSNNNKLIKGKKLFYQLSVKLSWFHRLKLENNMENLNKIDKID